MAKYSRFDPRNKKKARNKQRSLEKDIRIRKEEKEIRYMGRQADFVVYDDEMEEQDVHDRV